MIASIRHRRRRAEINIVPLVDVLTVLIFFFLVSMQFRNMTVLNISPPQIETAGRNEVVEQIEIGVDEEGTLFYNGREVSREQLRGLVEIAGNLTPNAPILILADEDSRLGAVAFVLDTLRKNGLNAIRLQSR